MEASGRGMFTGEEGLWDRKLNGRVRFMGDVCIWEREVYEIKRQIGGGIWEREVAEGDE